MPSAAPLTPAEGHKLWPGRLGDTYGPYYLQLGSGPEAAFVADPASQGATLLLRARDDAGGVVATLAAEAAPDAQGVWTLFTTELVTKALTLREGTYAFDARVTYADASVRTWLAGSWAVAARVSGGPP